MKLKPLGEKVLVKPFAADSVSPSGIHMVTKVENQAVRRGEVVARGSKISADLNEGDIVQFVVAYDAAKVTLNGVEHLLVEYEYILGVEEPEKVMAVAGAPS